MSKGISIQQMGGLALAFVLVAIIVGIGATIMTEIRSSQCTTYNETTQDCVVTAGAENLTTIASNISSQGIVGLGTLGDWLPTIAVIIAAAVVIGVIVKYFQ